MNSTAKAVALATAMILAFAGAVQIAARAKHVSGYFSGYRANHALAALSAALKGGDTIVMMGSSELTHSKEPMISYRLFPERLGQPLLGFGHAGMQHGAILAQLLAFADDLEGARLVIMVGPGWFAKEMHPENFLLYTPPYIAARILLNRRAYPEAYEHLERYVRAHALDFVAGSSLTDVMLGKAGGMTVVRQVWEGYAAYWLETLRFVFQYRATVSDDGRSPPDWAAFMTNGNAAQRKISQKNDAFVEDEYLEKYIKGWAGSGSPNVPIPQPQLDGPELADFEQLLALLKAAKAKPLFVIQGFNGLAYQDLSKWPTMIGRVRTRLERAGMPMLDLWEAYQQPSAYKDIQHIGTYNWIQVDRALNRYFLGAQP